MSAFKKQRGGLGRGLSSLLPPPPEKNPSNIAVNKDSNGKDGEYRTIAIEDLLPGDAQPRKVFKEKPLLELTESIRIKGILQPILVRRRKDGQLEIVAGERRWRAAQKAGLQEIPCKIGVFTDDEILTVALMENLQREDLDPIEEAEGYRRLSEDLNLSQEKIAQAVGKDRSTVANALRLLKLPERVREMVQGGELSMGHARALLGLEKSKHMEKMAKSVASQGLSVRKTEELIKAKRDAGVGKVGSPTKSQPSPAETDLRRRLERQLATRVELQHKAGKGKVILHFSSYDELEALIGRIGA
jgi:ParB family chromosome partitioning protein